MHRVADVDFFDDRSISRMSRCLHLCHGFMPMGIKRLPDRRDAPHPFPLQQSQQLLVDQMDPLHDRLRVGLLIDRHQGLAQTIKNGEQLPDDLLGRILAELFPLALEPFLGVVEVRKLTHIVVNLLRLCEQPFMLLRRKADRLARLVCVRFGAIRRAHAFSSHWVKRSVSSSAIPSTMARIRR